MAPRTRTDENDAPEGDVDDGRDLGQNPGPGAKLDPRSRQLVGSGTGEPVFGAAAPHPGDRAPSKAEIAALKASGAPGSGRRLATTIGPFNDPDTDTPVMFLQGETLPAWAEEQVKDHPYAFRDEANASPEEFDYAGSTVSEVEGFVGDDRDRAVIALNAERDRKGGPRLSLLRHLEGVAGGSGQ